MQDISQNDIAEVAGAWNPAANGPAAWPEGPIRPGHRQSRLGQRDESPAALPPAPRRPGAPVRRELVRRVRAKVQAGVYDTPERFEAAMHRLIESLLR